jgi:SpoVK/Ycf46/Vps4 family AAA+-type ATPase
LSLVRHGRVTPETLWELKAQALKKSGLLTLHRGRERFADLGGLDALKAFCRKALRPGAKHPLARARGILLLGVPGVGKSVFACALGNEVGRPTITLDVSALMGSLVGETERNVRAALRSIDAMAPCVCHIDELEKALAGAAGASGDSGVSARMLGTLLSWLADHESDVFVTATANDVSRLPPEFSRAERWDGVWFLDLPSVAEKAAIWKMYLDRFGLDPAQPKPADRDWTGAEVRACCRLARLLELPLVEAARNVVPVAVTAAESVERLRNWASGRCLSAFQPGLYVRDNAAAEKTGRKVSRTSSN